MPHEKNLDEPDPKIFVKWEDRESTINYDHSLLRPVLWVISVVLTMTFFLIFLPLLTSGLNWLITP